MKRFKIWSIAVAMLAALFLVSCDKDDDNDSINYDYLSGTWTVDYSEGVITEGYTHYTFSPKTSSEGTLEVYSMDWLAARDTTYHNRYTIDANGHLQSFRKTEDGSEQVYHNLYITRLTAKEMRWVFHMTDGTADQVTNLKRVEENESGSR